MIAASLHKESVPEVGNSSIAREIVKRSPFVYMRIDVIEQALRTVSTLEDVGPACDVIACKLARSKSSARNVRGR